MGRPGAKPCRRARPAVQREGRRGPAPQPLQTAVTLLRKAGHRAPHLGPPRARCSRVCICCPEGDLAERLSTPAWPPGGARQQRWVSFLLPRPWPCCTASGTKFVRRVMMAAHQRTPVTSLPRRAAAGGVSRCRSSPVKRRHDGPWPAGSGGWHHPADQTVWVRSQVGRV